MASKYKGIRIGYSQSWKPLRYGGPSNLITIAPARMGKSRDVLMPFLLDYPYSVVVIDPKGEFAAVTSRRRKQCGEVIYLDPFGLIAKMTKTPVRTSRYNPMQRLRAGSIEFSALADKLSEALILNESNGNGNSEFFTGGARNLVSMVQMGLVEHGAATEKNLNSLRDVITGAFHGGTVDIFNFCQSIMRQSSNPILRQKAAAFCTSDAKESRSLGDIRRTAEVQTAFLSNEALAPTLTASDFTFADLKKRVITVYVVLPLDFLDISGRYFRLCVASGLSELLATGKGVPTVLLIDEAFQIGHLKSVENAMSMSAGMGLQIWPVFQDLSQLSGLYPHTWETFLSNAGVRMCFTPRDQKTSEYLSNLCGQTEHRTVCKSVGMADEPNGLLKRLFSRNPQANVPHVSVSFGTAARPLMLPHECRELPGDEMLLFIERVNGVIRAKRRPYWDEPEFRGQYDKNPYFKT